MKILRLLATWLLLLTLPAQALAAYAPSASCAGEQAVSAPQVHGDMPAAAVHDHDPAAPAGHQHHDDGQPADAAAGNSCCHHVFSGVPSASIPGTPAAPDSVVVHVSLLSTLYFPELPQRPPRA